MHPQTPVLVHFAALFLLLIASRPIHADHPTIQALATVNSVTSVEAEISLGGSAGMATAVSDFLTFEADSPDISIFGGHEHRRRLLLANMSNQTITIDFKTDAIDAMIVDLLDIADRYIVCCGGDCVFTNGDQVFGPPEVTARYELCTGSGRAFINGAQVFIDDPWLLEDPTLDYGRDPQLIDNVESWSRMLDAVVEIPMFGDFARTRAGAKTRPMKPKPHPRSGIPPSRTAVLWGVLLGGAVPAVMIALLILIGMHTPQSNRVLEVLVGCFLVLALGLIILWFA